MAYNILIVDDSASMRQVVKKIINMSGFPVAEFYEAGNGLEGLEECKSKSIDVILTDLNMPQMDGFTFIDKLQENEKFHEIPVVVVSTEGRSTVIEQVTNMGVVEYIKKPFHPELIAETLKNLLGMDNGQQESRDTQELDF